MTKAAVSAAFISFCNDEVINPYNIIGEKIPERIKEHLDKVFDEIETELVKLSLFPLSITLNY